MIKIQDYYFFIHNTYTINETIKLDLPEILAAVILRIKVFPKKIIILL